MEAALDIGRDRVLGCPSKAAKTSKARTSQDVIPDLQAHVRALPNDQYTLELIVRGASCGGCLSKIETALRSLDGIESVRMNLSTARLKTVWAGPPALVGNIYQTLIDLGYAATPFMEDKEQERRQSEQSILLRAMAVAGFATMNVMMLSVAVWSGGTDMASATRSLLHWISAFIALPVVAYSGQVFFRSALSALKARQTNMDVPISLALILACGLSLYETIVGNIDTYFDAALMLTFLLLIGRYLDARLKARAGDAALRLAALEAPTALRIGEDDRPTSVPSVDLRPGDLILIPAGQKVPADCEIVKGRTTIDAHIATGESEPTIATCGDRLYSGSINLGHPIEAQIVNAAEDSFLSDVRDLVEFGLQARGRYARLSDRVARAYVPVVHTLALLTGIGWWLATQEVRPALLNAMAVLIITCPCALGLAIPAVHIVTTGRLFRKAILVKSGDALERLASVDRAVFDKTGTLTDAGHVLQSTISDQILCAAASLADASHHPLSRAIAATTDDRIQIENRREIAGEGLSGTLPDGRDIRLGSSQCVGLTDSDQNAAGTWVRIGEDSPMQLQFEERLRDGTQKTIAALHDMGLSMEILSGDTASRTARMGTMLGLEASGAVKPRDKRAAVDSQSSQATGRTLMIGDGINDAPALAAADASIALASASDISRATADFIILDDRIGGVADSVRLARLSQKRIKENLSLAIIYNLCAIPLAVAGLVNPLIAAVAMSGSSLLVTLNALRMARA